MQSFETPTHLIKKPRENVPQTTFYHVKGLSGLLLLKRVYT